MVGNRMGMRRHLGRSEVGAAMVEFALVAPIFLLIVFGIINFGYAFGQKLALNQAVREGTRGAVAPNTNGGAKGSSVNNLFEIRDIVRESTGGLVEKSEVKVIVGGVDAPASGSDSTSAGCDRADIDPGDPLTVRAEYRTTFLTPWLLPGLPTSVTLNSEAVFRCEW